MAQRRDEILEAMRSHQVVIVVGETGSGKTTQLPKMAYELACAEGKDGRIGCTQPRRLLGDRVGYQVRFVEKVREQTNIKFMTDGILLAETQRDRDLRQYDTLIIDEAHERSLNIDFILGYLKNLLERRNDLRVVVSSATLDAGRFSDYFGGEATAKTCRATSPAPCSGSATSMRGVTCWFSSPENARSASARKPWKEKNSPTPTSSRSLPGSGLTSRKKSSGSIALTGAWCWPPT